MAMIPREEMRDLYDRYNDVLHENPIRINHSDVRSSCNGSSKSMILTRGDDDGSFNAKCFRCGDYGRTGGNAYAALKRKAGSQISREGTGECAGLKHDDLDGIVDRAIKDQDQWPPRARVWADSTGIPETERTRLGWMYDPESRRVMLPIENKEKKVIYAQGRKVYEDDGGQKYLTYGDNRAIIQFGDSTEDNIVLVEDYVSGVKVSKIRPALVLCGTALNSHHLKFLINSGYNRFTIFLDDDNTQVRKNTLKIKKVLDKLGTVNVIHSGGKDPKEYTYEELKEML